MPRIVNKVAGWKSRKLGNVIFYRCPACGYECEYELLSGSDGLVTCGKCGRQNPFETFTAIKRKRSIVECFDCGREVPLVPSTCGWLGYICSCSSYVAICHGNHVVHPNQILNTEWNPRIVNRAEQLGQGIYFLPCRTTKDFLVLRVLQATAKEEDGRFMFGEPEEFSSGLYFNSSARAYLGFLIWSENEFSVLRQLFIAKNERRKGHAERLIKFWVRRYADRLNSRFGIESPNKTALKLHLKLGHLKIDGDSYAWIKCFTIVSL